MNYNEPEQPTPTGEEEDYFESTEVPEEKPKAPKKPKYSPENPRYWEQEPSRWEHLRPRSRLRVWLTVTAVAVGLGLVTAIWLRYFSPYVDDTVEYGYVEHIEREGTVFKTYEGILLPYKELRDTTRLYRRDFVFTAADAHVAAQLKRMQQAALPVCVHYRRYHGRLPWRGNSTTLITQVDSVDPAKILPPEYTPASVGSRDGDRDGNGNGMSASASSQ